MGIYLQAFETLSTTDICLFPVLPKFARCDILPQLIYHLVSQHDIKPEKKVSHSMVVVACWEFKIKFEKYNGEKIAQIGSRCCDPRKIYHRNHNWQCPIFSHLMFIQFAFDDDDRNNTRESTIKRKTPLTKILIYFSYVIQHNLSSETHWSLRRYKNSI